MTFELKYTVDDMFGPKTSSDIKKEIIAYFERSKAREIDEIFNDKSRSFEDKVNDTRKVVDKYNDMTYDVFTSTLRELCCVNFLEES